MNNLTSKKISSALISVYDKTGINTIVKALLKNDVEIISTGGTYDYLTKKGFSCKKVEEITTYPSILGGRVKTLHPLIFGGILSRRDNQDDQHELEQYKIPTIDLVIVDLYPFETTLINTQIEQEINEMIDIGGNA